jgi:hypothetical protein
MAPPCPKLRTPILLLCLILGGTFSGVGALLCTLFTIIGGPVWDDWILDARGALVDAKATRVPEVGRRQGRKGTRWATIEVAFTDRGGRVEHADLRVPTGMLGRARSGEPIQIEYDPESPERARARGHRASLFGAFVALPAAFMLAGLPVLLFGLRLVARRKAFVATAIVTEGRVEDARALGGKGSTVRVTYAFSTPGGEVRGTALHNGEASAGAPLWIAYLPSAPSESEIVELDSLVETDQTP